MTAREAQESPTATCEVWLVDLAAAHQALDEIEHTTPRLSADVVEKIGQMADGDARRERRTAHIALRLAIERMFGAGTRGRAFDIGEKGKPALPIAGDFSLSHIPGRALIAVSCERPIGVDLERDRPIPMAADRRRAIEAAAEALDPRVPLPDDPAARTLQAWVRLEALGKARGTGIGALLTQLGVTRGPFATADGGGERPGLIDELVVHDLDLESALYGAIACVRGLPTPPLKHFPQSVEDLAALVGG